MLKEPASHGFEEFHDTAFRDKNCKKNCPIQQYCKPQCPHLYAYANNASLYCRRRSCCFVVVVVVVIVVVVVVVVFVVVVVVVVFVVVVVVVVVFVVVVFVLVVESNLKI